MELNLSSTAELRERFRQTQPDSQQRIALLRAALTGDEVESFIGQLIAEHSIGLRMDEPQAAADAHTNVEMMSDALQHLPNELPHNAYAACTELVRLVRAATDEARLLSKLVTITCAVMDGLGLLQQMAADAMSVASGRDAGPAGAKLSRLFQLAQGSARVGEEVLADGLDGATAPQPLLDALAGVVVAIAGSAGQLVTAVTQTATAAESLDLVWRISGTTLGVLNNLTAHEQDWAALQATGATQRRDTLEAQVTAAAASYADTLAGLPAELWTHILHFARPADVERMGLTSKTFEALVTNYQRSTEGEEKHTMAVGAADKRRKKAIGAGYQAWFTQHPRRSTALLKKHVTAIRELYSAIRFLYSDSNPANKENFHIVEAIPEGDEWRRAQSELYDFNNSVLGSMYWPLELFRPDSRPHTMSIRLIEGTDGHTYDMIRTTLSGLLARWMDANCALPDAERRRDRVALEINAVERARMSVLASLDALENERDRHEQQRRSKAQKS